VQFVAAYVKEEVHDVGGAYAAGQVQEVHRVPGGHERETSAIAENQGEDAVPHARFPRVVHLVREPSRDPSRARADLRDLGDRDMRLPPFPWPTTEAVHVRASIGNVDAVHDLACSKDDLTRAVHETAVLGWLHAPELSTEFDRQPREVDIAELRLRILRSHDRRVSRCSA
jgi:hypothetical protein